MLNIMLTLFHCANMFTYILITTYTLKCFKIFLIMFTPCSILSYTYYAQNYAGIMGCSLPVLQLKDHLVRPNQMTELNCLY